MKKNRKKWLIVSSLLIFCSFLFLVFNISVKTPLWANEKKVAKSAPPFKVVAEVNYVKVGGNKLAFDIESGEGFVTEEESKQGWIRSYDTAEFGLDFSFHDWTEEYSDIQLQLTGDGINPYTYVPSTGFFYQNYSFSSTGMSVKKDLDTKSLSFSYNVGSGGASLPTVNDTISTPKLSMEIYGAPYGAEIGMENLKVKIISAVNKQGEKIDFTNDNFVFDVPNPFTKMISEEDEIVNNPSNSDGRLKVNSKVSIESAIMLQTGSKARVPFDELVGEEVNKNLQVYSVAVGASLQKISHLIGVNSRSTSYVGTAPPTGGQLTLVLGQSVTGKTSDNKTVNISLGSDGQIPYMALFDYGELGTTYEDRLHQGYPNYRPELLSTTFSSPGGFGYGGAKTKQINMQQNQQNGAITIDMAQYLTNGSFFRDSGNFAEAGFYIVYDNSQVSSDIVQQEYNITTSSLKYVDDKGSLQSGGIGYYKKASWKENYGSGSKDYSSFNTYSAYGREITKSGEKKFALLQSSNGYDYSSSGNGLGYTMRKENIIVGSAGVGQAYTTTTENGVSTQKNWLQKKTTLLQKWNPNESKLLGAAYNYFIPEESYGDVQAIQYGIAVERDEQGNIIDNVTNFTNTFISEAAFKDYVWYNSLEEAEQYGEVSAVYGESLNLDEGINNPGGTSSKYFNLYTKREIVGNIGGLDDDGNSYITVTSGSRVFENPDTAETVECFSPQSTTVYEPTQYEDGEKIGGNSPGGSFGDTLYITPYELSLEKQAYDSETGEKKSKFNKSDIITWGLTGYFQIAPDTSYSKVKAVFRDILGASFSYVPGSSEFGDLKVEPTITVDKDGYQTLVWEIEVDPMQPLPELKFKTAILKAGSSTNTAYFKAPLQREVTSRYSVTVLEEYISGINKFSLLPSIEKNGTMEFLVRPYNNTAGTLVNSKLLDVFPFKGDSRGSDFSGIVQLTDIKIFDRRGNPIDGVTVYYTNESIAEDTNVSEVESSSSWPGQWQEYSGGEVEAKAIYMKLPNILSGENLDIYIYLKTVGNQGGDLYRNTAWLGLPSGARSPSSLAESKVLSRAIQGQVWLDDNYNGQMDPTEPLKEGIPVALFSKDESGDLTRETQNAAGETLTNIVTDSTGTYQFDNLKAGNYVVGFDLSKEERQYWITHQKYPGVPDLLNSKVSETEMEGDYHITSKDDPIFLPKAESMANPDFVVDSINMGILEAPNLEVDKFVYDQEDVDNRKDINGSKVKIGDTIYYEIVVKNTGENSFIKNVKVQDTLPEGLKYVPGTLNVVRPNVSKEFLPDKYFKDDYMRLETEELCDLKGPDEKLVLGFKVEITGSAIGELTNIATATGIFSTLNPEKNSEEVNNYVVTEPKLAKTVSPSENIKIGDILTYTIKASVTEKSGNWSKVKIEDILPDYLIYQSGTTELNGQSIGDEDIWKDNKLFLLVGDVSDGAPKVVTFKVQVVSKPTVGNEVVNIAKGFGEGIDENKNPVPDQEAEVRVPFGNDGIKLHVRQVIVDPQDSLVVPKDGYLMLQQLDAANKKLVNGMTTIQMKSEKEGAQITSESFTTVLVALLGDVQTLDLNLPIIPEYYAYLGSVVSTDGTKIASDHVSAKMEKDVRPKLSVSEAEEYWVTFFIQPKLNEEDQNLPRPYSWDTVSNQFGKLIE